MSVIGSVVEQEVTFLNTNGVLTNPSTVTGTAKTPSGVAVVASSVTNVSTGVYDVLYDGNEAGLWFFRVEGSGGGVDAVIEGSFCVQASSVE